MVDLHVTSKSVQVVVGLLTFNDAVVFEWIELTILQENTHLCILIYIHTQQLALTLGFFK